MLNRILIASFIVLFVITIIEVGYLFYSQNQPSTSKQEAIVVVPVPSIKAPILSPKTNQSNDNLKLLNAASYYATTYEYQGKIVGINNKGGVVKTFNSEDYVWKIKLQLQTKEGIIPLQFNDNDLKVIRVVHVENNKENPITFSDLKNNDQIIIRVTNDFKKRVDETLIEGKITKL